MKYFILLSAGIILSLSAAGQTCKYEQNEVDEFTGEKVIISKYRLFIVAKGRSIYTAIKTVISNSDTNHFVLIDYTHRYEQPYGINEESKLQYKLENDEVISLTPNNRIDKMYLKKKHRLSYADYMLEIEYPISKLDLIKLIESKLKYVRIHHMNTEINEQDSEDYERGFDLTKDIYTRFKDCILEQL